jgi:hypothetical protein
LGCGNARQPAPSPTPTPAPGPAHAAPRPSPTPFACHGERPWLAAGRYRLVLAAQVGSRKGRRASGTLELRVASADDVSPRTGELATASMPIALWGWTDLNMSRVAAPICADDIHPPPNSRDPEYPGVVVWGECLPSAGALPLILVSTVLTPRNGSSYTDGCGIVLTAKRWAGDCYHGHWSGSGLVHDGAGTFTLCASKPA